ncbi:MAG: BatD family protein, partial [Bryobacteraceae bacterium]
MIALIALASAPLLRADAPTVTAVLSSSETEVDRPVQLQIKVTGDQSATPPNDIAVDGLDIRYAGQSQLVEGRNFHFSYSFVYNYTVMPLKAGSFTIPPQTIHTDGGNMRTPALTLNVAPDENGATSSSRQRGNNDAVDTRKLVFAELILPKTSAYVGEEVPVEIRLGFNTRVPAQLAEGPTLTGQGFTTQRMPQPKQSIETINGRSYQVVTFKTAIAATRSGKFTIGPVEAKAVVQVPRQAGSGGGRSPFDVFGMNDPFNDPFFNDPFGGMTEQREVKIKSREATLEVKPLPADAPASFTGAVGHFDLTTDVKPKTVQIGDPLTVTAAISGRGNFDSVTAPTLEDEHGWHTYPPSANFKPDDDVGLSGTKSFEMVITPNEQKKAVPPLVFSYFDPLKENYVTLKGDRMPVVVEGGTAPTAAPIAASPAATPAVAAGPTPAPQADDILYQLTDHPHWIQTFEPVF